MTPRAHELNDADDDHDGDSAGRRTGHHDNRHRAGRDGAGLTPGPRPKAARPRPEAPTTATRTTTLLDSAQVAHRLGVTERLIRRLVAERRITYVRVGRFIRFDPHDIDTWIEAAKVDVATARHDGRLSTPGGTP